MVTIFLRMLPSFVTVVEKLKHRKMTEFHNLFVL